VYVVSPRASFRASFFCEWRPSRTSSHPTIKEPAELVEPASVFAERTILRQPRDPAELTSGPRLARHLSKHECSPWLK
jgi:hypothetical protein